MISESALRDVVVRSETLWSRVGRERSPTRAGADAAALIHTWRSVLKSDDTVSLEQRLALEGLTLAQVAARLKSDTDGPEGPLPSWSQVLNRILDEIHASPSSVQTDESASMLPFRELFPAFTASALELLRERCSSLEISLSPSATACLEADLGDQLAEQCCFALQFEFSRWRQASGEPLREGEDVQYRAFLRHLLAGGLTAFFQKYPVLSRLVGIAVERWVDAIAELLTRLEADRSTLEKTFHRGLPLGPVVHLSSNLSDLHERGRRVVLLRFEPGLSLAYKPRSIAMDRAFYGLLHWLNEHTGLLDLYVPLAVDLGSHGWIELIVRQDCGSADEVCRYYRRAGMLLSLLSVVKGTDFHYGNILARGEHPVLIDLESLCASRLFRAVEAEPDGDTETLLDVVRCGLLPNHQIGPKGRLFDVSGLSGQGGQETGFTVPHWLAVNTDTMRLAQRMGTTSDHDNVPRCRGRRAHACDYRQEIIDGFQAMGRVLIERSPEILGVDGPLAAFDGLPARLVFRPTSLYHLLLRGTLAPDLLRCGLKHSIQLEALARFLLRRDGHERLWPLLRVELQALEEGEVPFFYAGTNGTGISSMGSLVASDVLSESSYAAVRRNVVELCPSRIEDQVQAIRWALSQHAIDRWPEALSPTLTPGESEAAALVVAAKALGDQLLERALRCHTGPLWFGPEFNETSNRQTIRPSGYDLHGGSPGIAVFLAALGRLIGGEFGEMALAVIETSRRRELSAAQWALGGALGEASLLYSWLVVGALLNRESLVDETVSRARAINPEDFPRDAPTDIIRGLAGTLACLLAIYERSGDAQVLERASACGRLLLLRRESTPGGERAWRSRHGPFLTGFAHGSSGIGYMLLRLFEATRSTAFLEAAFEAIAFETRGFDDEHNAWPDFRYSAVDSRKVFGNAWCHGSTGIGLLRLEALRHESSRAWLRDVDLALGRAGEESLPPDQLCCGMAGRAELLLRAEHQLERPELGQIARRLALGSLQRAQKQGKFSLGKNGGLWNPGLFLGTAGIGYEFLRVACPDRLPALLTWEAPA